MKIGDQLVVHPQLLEFWTQGKWSLEVDFEKNSPWMDHRLYYLWMDEWIFFVVATAKVAASYLVVNLYQHHAIP